MKNCSSWGWGLKSDSMLCKACGRRMKKVRFWMLTLIVWPWLALIWSFPDKGLFLSVNLCLSFNSTTFLTWGSQYPENLGNFKTASTSTKPDCLKKSYFVSLWETFIALSWGPGNTIKKKHKVKIICKIEIRSRKTNLKISSIKLCTRGSKRHGDVYVRFLNLYLWKIMTGK